MPAYHVLWQLAHSCISRNSRNVFCYMGSGRAYNEAWPWCQTRSTDRKLTLLFKIHCWVSCDSLVSNRPCSSSINLLQLLNPGRLRKLEPNNGTAVLAHFSSLPTIESLACWQSMWYDCPLTHLKWGITHELEARTSAYSGMGKRDESRLFCILERIGVPFFAWLIGCELKMFQKNQDFCSTLLL